MCIPTKIKKLSKKGHKMPASNVLTLWEGKSTLPKLLTEGF